MSREKQIEEMAKHIYYTTMSNKDEAQRCAETLYNDMNYRKQEWISVDERLPEEDDDYIVNLHYPHGINIATKRSYSKKRKWYGVSVNHWYTEVNVTHWMPLPEAPKMKGGAE